MIDFSTFLGPTIISFLDRVLSDPSDKQPLLDLQSSVAEMMVRIIRSTSKVKEEMNKLRLVCSDHLLEKLNEYGKVADDQVGNLREFLSKLNILSGNAKVLIEEFIKKQSRTDFVGLKLAIEKIMRDELRIKK